MVFYISETKDSYDVFGQFLIPNIPCKLLKIKNLLNPRFPAESVEKKMLKMKDEPTMLMITTGQTTKCHSASGQFLAVFEGFSRRIVRKTDGMSQHSLGAPHASGSTTGRTAFPPARLECALPLGCKKSALGETHCEGSEKPGANSLAPGSSSYPHQVSPGMRRARTKSSFSSKPNPGLSKIRYLPSRMTPPS
jgi:hypothetical protein